MPGVLCQFPWNFHQFGAGARFGIQKLNIHEYPPTLSPVAVPPVIGVQRFFLDVEGTETAWSDLLERGNIRSWRENGRIVFNDPVCDQIEISFGKRVMNPLVAGIAGLTLPVSDVEASLAFYSRLACCAPQALSKNGRIALENGFLKLIKCDGSCVPGAADFCLVTDTPIEEAYLSLNDMPLLTDLDIVQRTGALGSMRSFYLRDPDGNLVEIAEYSQQPRIQRDTTAAFR